MYTTNTLFETSVELLMIFITYFSLIRISLQTHKIKIYNYVYLVSYLFLIYACTTVVFCKN